MKSNPQMTAGEALLSAGLGREAIPYLEAAHSSEPHRWEHLANLGVAHRMCDNLKFAEGCLLQALEIDDKAHQVWNNLGNVLEDLGDLAGAHEAYRKSFGLSPEQRTAFGLATSQLRMGDWTSGLPLYEFARMGFSWKPIHGIRVYEGQPLEGKEILIVHEGGYGDLFWMAGCIREMQHRGAKVTMLAYDSQVDLFNLNGIKALPSSKAFNAEHFDFHTAVLSLPFVLGLTPDTVPRWEGGLRVPNEDFTWAAKALANGAKPKVGICWQAEENSSARKFRSIDPKELEPLRELPVRWIALTKDVEVPEWIEDKKLDTWEKTAAIISGLDAVVTVDTAVSHLAGLIGKDCFTLLPLNSDWKWLTDYVHSIWYEEMGLIRNTDPYSFAPAVEEVKEAVSMVVL